MTIEKTAYGAGTRNYENFPNVLRLMLGEEEQLRITNYELRIENEENSTGKEQKSREQRADFN